jgi:hypothetical protein
MPAEGECPSSQGYREGPPRMLQENMASCTVKCRSEARDNTHHGSRGETRSPVIPVRGCCPMGPVICHSHMAALC